MKHVLPVILAALGATVAVILAVKLQLGADGPLMCAAEGGSPMPICRQRLPASWALVLAPLTGALLGGGIGLTALRRSER